MVLIRVCAFSGYDGGSSDSECDGPTMNEQERLTPLMPDFWVIIKIHEDRVEVFSHARYSYTESKIHFCIYIYATQDEHPSNEYTSAKVTKSFFVRATFQSVCAECLWAVNVLGSPAIGRSSFYSHPVNSFAQCLFFGFMCADIKANVCLEISRPCTFNASILKIYSKQKDANVFHNA